MKIIPRFAGGNSFFTVYNSIQSVTPNPQSYANLNRKSDSISLKDSESNDSKKDDTKGQLTEKDLYSMIKDVNGLPNEMQQIIASLKNTMSMSSLVSLDSSQLSNQYLNALYKLKIANQNKEKLESSVKKSQEDGSLGEVAITLSGNLLASDSQGNVREISLEEYKNNHDGLQLLTNSNLAWLRKYSPKYSFQQSDSTFETISNGMGFESFQKLLDQAKSQLGSYRYDEQGVSGKEALLGLRALSGLSKEEQQEYLKQATDGTYTYQSSTNSNATQIKALVDYLTVVMPKRAKVWASVKTGIMDQNKATQTLVGQYLSGQLNSQTSYKVTLDDDSSSKEGKSKRGGSPEDPKEGFWRQLQSDKAGDSSTFVTLIGKKNMSVEGKYYGITPGMEDNKSLTKYIGDSNVGYLIKNRQNITFGDQQISPDNFDDIMVNAGGGAMTVTLPITQDGKINFAIMDTYSQVINKLKAAGLKQNTPEFEKKKAQVLNKIGLGYLVDASTGTINPKYFGHFLVLEGVASSKAKAQLGAKKQDFVVNDFIDDVSDDDTLYETVIRALSSKDKGEYELDHNWISFNNDKLYKGNIYIPINTNPLNGANADNNDVRESTAQRYEYEQQVWDKQQKQQSTSSSELWQ